MRSTVTVQLLLNLSLFVESVSICLTICRAGLILSLHVVHLKPALPPSTTHDACSTSCSAYRVSLLYVVYKLVWKNVVVLIRTAELQSCEVEEQIYVNSIRSAGSMSIKLPTVFDHGENHQKIED